MHTQAEALAEESIPQAAREASGCGGGEETVVQEDGEGVEPC